MKVTIQFDIDIDAVKWDSENHPLDCDGDPERTAREVRAHAETVIRDLFADMGWSIEAPPEDGSAVYPAGGFIDPNNH